MSAYMIRHTHEHGTTFEGSSKGDGVWEILRPLGWRYSRNVGIYVRGSRDRDADRALIARTTAALETAGHTVAEDIDNAARTAAERRAALDERATDRAERLDDRADRSASEASRRLDAVHAIGDGIPFGQPILAGHHSQRRAERDVERMDAGMRASIDAAVKAERTADRAAGTRANMAHRHDPRAIMRRIEKLETDRRGYARELAGCRREFKNGSGDVVAADEFPPAGPGRAGDLARWDARDAEEIEHLRGELTELAAAGTFTTWTPDDFQKGDHANVGGSWYVVVRINRKSVSVAGRFFGDGDRATPVTFDEIHGRRRDGMQWDTPTGEPWPVDLARKVSRWGRVAAAARRDNARYGTDEHAANRNAGYAQRIVHGLDLSASAREVSTIADSIEGTDARRALAATYLAVFDRLQDGERVPAIVADVTPITGAPAWRIPTDREAVTVRAGRGWPTRPDMLFVEPGDLIVGRRDGGGFGGGPDRLIRGFCGPVAAVSDVRDRRERGEFLTITLVDGTEQEFRNGEWFEVHRAGTWETEDDSSPADANQRREEHAAVTSKGPCPSCGNVAAIAGQAPAVKCAHCEDVTVPLQAGEEMGPGPYPYPPVTVVTPDGPVTYRPGLDVLTASVRPGNKPDAARTLPDMTGGKTWCVVMASLNAYHVRLSGHRDGEVTGYHLVSGNDVRLNVADIESVEPLTRDCTHDVRRTTSAEDTAGPAVEWHRAHPATSGPFCVAYRNDVTAPNDARSTFIRADVTCPPCLATYEPGGDDPGKLGAVQVQPVTESPVDADGAEEAAVPFVSGWGALSLPGGSL